MTGAVAGGSRPNAIRPLRWEDEAAYGAFCEREFGRTYQGRSGYLRWLYEDNPTGRGVGDALIATGPSDEVVACIHRMRLPWRVRGGTVEIPTLHNLMVAEAFRGGLGFFLLTSAVKGESHAIVPGVEGRLADAYVRMKYQPLRSRWYRRIVNPGRTAWQTALHRLARPEPTRRAPADLLTRMHGFEVTTRPDARSIADISAALVASAATDGAGAVARVDWTPELVAWRFFAPRGPRHVLARDLDDDALAILSIGPRHGVTVARLMAWSPVALPPSVVLRIGALARKLGAAVLLAYDVRPGETSSLSASGWAPRPEAPSSFLYARDRASLEVDLDGGGTDLGFEALPDS